MTTTTNNTAPAAALAKAPAKAQNASAKAPSKPAKGAAATKPAKAPAKPAAKPPLAAPAPTGQAITALATDTGAREGTIRDKLRRAVLSSKTTTEALKKVVKHEGEEYPVTQTVLTNMVALKLIKLGKQT